MNLKICDFCKKPIEKREDYIKLQKIKHEGKILKYLGTGHMCLSCEKKLKGTNEQ